MLALIEKGNANEAHPVYWAPFVVVGEGSAPETPQALRAAPSPTKATGRKTRSGEQKDWAIEFRRQQ